MRSERLALAPRPTGSFKPGDPRPEWAAALGESRPTAAALLEEPVFDDGLRVVIEFDDSYALDVFVDHNRGGVVSDVFVGAPLAEVRQDGGFTYREIELDEARARIDAALSALDRTLDPPVDADVYELRAMLDARLRLLPDGFEVPDERGFVDRNRLSPTSSRHPRAHAGEATSTPSSSSATPSTSAPTSTTAVHSGGAQARSRSS